MTIENIKKEVNSLIKCFEKEIENENKSEIKSFNYDIFCQRLEEAKLLKKDIEAAGAIAEEVSELFSARLGLLKFPIL